MANIPPKRRTPSDLSGIWTGYYAYDLTDEAVMFTAWLKEEKGRLVGSILEENLSAGEERRDRLTVEQFYGPSVKLLGKGDSFGELALRAIPQRAHRAAQFLRAHGGEAGVHFLGRHETS